MVKLFKWLIWVGLVICVYMPVWEGLVGVTFGEKGMKDLV